MLGAQMVVITVTCWVEGWSAKLDVGSTHDAERHLTVSARLYDQDRYKFGGADVNSTSGFIPRKHEPQETAIHKALGLDPDRTYDVAPGELRPIGGRVQN
jgi:hypothetical protein